MSKESSGDRRRSSGRGALAVATLAGLAALTSACGNGVANDASTSPAEVAAVPVEVRLPERGEMLAIYSGTAPIEAEQEATVAAKVGGEVRAILVEEGDVVEAGQLLARLDGDRLRYELKQSEANLARLERDYNRNLELIKKGLVAEGAVDNIRFEMEALRAARDLARLELGYTEIRAPIPGVVSARFIKVGNTIAAGDATFRVTDLDPLIAYVHVPEREFRKLKAGQRADLTVDALGVTGYSATVARISPIVDPATGTFKATLEIHDESGRVKPGMFARVNIVVDRRPDALRIPRAALVETDGTESVFVVRDSVAVQQPVRTGLTNAGWVEVTEGLDGDEQVVVIGQNGLKSGNAVEVVSLEAPAS
ncbi:MAG TPA: efflux RND transporter periplasmic adaptor subunit [Steroidobacteraceae bacterium]|nr:efflux RND transporter periplasmic adaptor subunit [Steroidobacteraceae bacterium]